MKPMYNKRQIMKNAWYLKRMSSMDFSACLRKAWRNEKLAMLTRRVEGRMEEPKATEYRPELLTVPGDFYGVSGQYYGD